MSDTGKAIAVLSAISITFAAMKYAMYRADMLSRQMARESDAIKRRMLHDKISLRVWLTGLVCGVMWGITTGILVNGLWQLWKR